MKNKNNNNNNNQLWIAVHIVNELNERTKTIEDPPPVCPSVCWLVNRIEIKSVNSDLNWRMTWYCCVTYTTTAHNIQNGIAYMENIVEVSHRGFTNSDCSNWTLYPSIHCSVYSPNARQISILSVFVYIVLRW